VTETYDIDIDGETYSIQIDEMENGQLRATVSGVEYIVKLPEGTGSAPAPRRRSSSGGSRVKSGTVSTSIPGKIVTLEIAQGETVVEGQVILILEAMKMQNEVTAPISGTITSVNCSEGDNVEANMALVVIEPNSEEGEENE
jgi:biotin carboxyl carrier protein